MMNRKVKTFLTAFIVVSVAALILLVLLHYRLKSKIKVTYEEEAGDIEVRIEGIHYTGTREGRLAWELLADSAVRGRASDDTTLEAVNFICYTADGHKITLKAPSGMFSESKGYVTASGGVDVTSEEGYRLRAQTVDFSTETRLISSEGHVRITSDRLDVTGVGMSVDVEHGVMKLNKDVHALIRDGEL